MKKKGGWLVIGIIIIVMVVLIVGYFLQQSAKANLLEVQVTYSFGSSWAGWIDTLIVNNNGSVVLQEQIQNNNTIKSLQLSNDEDKEFRRLVVDANIFSLKDEYTCAPNCPTDVSGSNLRFIINNREKNISITSYPNLPSNLSLIINKMNSWIPLFNYP